MLAEVKNIKNIGLQNLSAIKKIILFKKYSDSDFDYKGKDIGHVGNILSFIQQNNFFPKNKYIERLLFIRY